jgi:hypothetical protein
MIGIGIGIGIDFVLYIDVFDAQAGFYFQPVTFIISIDFLSLSLSLSAKIVPNRAISRFNEQLFEKHNHISI